MSPSTSHTSHTNHENDDDNDDGDDDKDKTDAEDEGKRLLIHFYTALANLKMLGVLKSSSTTGTGVKGKGLDGICRTAWKGL